MNQIIFHIDVNSAYLSWSALHALANGSPVDLREVPSIIGGDIEKRHGVVLAKSIPAKVFHIQTGEPIVQALRKCPGLVVASPDHSLYQEQSSQLMTFLSDICPDIEQVSVDECYMDYTPISGRYESPEAAAQMIKDSVRAAFGYTVNIGISDRKVLAKMASDFQKPDRIHTLYSYEIKEKMWPLSVASLYMCGQSAAAALRNLEIITIGDLAQADTSILTANLKSHGNLLWEYANGIDPSKVITEQTGLKGIGNSITLREDVFTKESAHQALLSLADTVSARLRESGQLAGMINTEIKYSTFKTVSHQTTLFSPVCTTQAVWQTACTLFDEIWNGTPIRLLGIRTSRLVSHEDPVQLSLFDTDSISHKQKQLDTAVDKIRKKYGSSSIVRGSLLQSGDDYKKH